MGRPERAVDAGEGPVHRFARALRMLRQETGGITYRAMAGRTRYTASTLSRAANGEQLPSLAVTLAYVTACGGDAEEWERRWREASEQVALAAQREEGDGEADAPYPGLSRFEPGDSARFFGREQLVADLVELVRGCRFTVVFGPSGSGKSSLLRAGLIPALQGAADSQARPVAIRRITSAASGRWL